MLPRIGKRLQLHEHVKKVRTKTLVIKVFAKILCNLNRFVLWQLRGACDVEQEAAKLRERRFFVSAAWRIVISTSLGSTAVITAVVVAAVIWDDRVSTGRPMSGQGHHKASPFH